MPLREHCQRGDRGSTTMNRGRRSLSSMPTECLVNSAWSERDTG